MELKWINPEKLLPPHRVSRPVQVKQLAMEFVLNGWDTTKPALIGYECDGFVQLLNGSHRHAAALQANIYVPVIVWPYEQVERVWGRPEWLKLMASGDTY